MGRHSDIILALNWQVVMVLNGTIGARLHIAFPVLNRSSFGFWLSYFTVISRVILSMFWFAIQVSLSECFSHILIKYILLNRSLSLVQKLFTKC